MMVKMRIAVLAFAARIFSVLVAIIVALLVAPEIFGLYGRLQMLGLVFMVFAFLRLERAVVASPSMREACKASKTGLLIMPVAALAMVYLALIAIPESRTAQLIPPLFFLSLLGRGLILLTHSWLSRWGKQELISLLIVIQAATQVMVQLFLLSSDVPPLVALMVGEIAGSLLACLIAGLKGHRVVKRIIAIDQPFQIFQTQRILMLANLPAALMSQALVALPLIAYGRLADPVSTGHLALAWRIAEAPMQMLAATATSLAITTGLWSRHEFGSDDKKKAAVYVSLIIGIALALVIAAMTSDALLHFLSPFITTLPSPRLLDTAQFVPFAVLITAGIALGGPHADLVTFAGAERLGLLIHAGALSMALALYFMTSEPTAFLLYFGSVILLRSLCLWILLPHAVRAQISGK
jgi:hypothetical protein